MDSTEKKATVDFGKLVHEHFDTLTKSEKRIARYLLKNQDEAAFLSAAELASRLELSEATAVRFAQSMGFSGFPDMREAFQTAFRSRVTHSVRLRARLKNSRQDGDIFERLTSTEIDYLTQALRTVDRAAIYQAVNLLRERERVFVFGIGPSISLVNLLEIRLRRFGRQVIPLTTSGREILEPLLLMTGSDLLFAIGFFDVTPALQLVLNHAQACGCVSILLTDTLGSIIGNQADVVLAARRGPISAFHSLTVPMTIINTLLLALAQTDQERAMSNLDRLDELRQTYAFTAE
jgi:DNA-binding MurR/RpiR family transcriptional regulator